MKNSLTGSRRDVLKLSTLAALGASPLMGLADSVLKADLPADPDLKVFIFSKHLQFLDYKAMSEASKEMGFDGIDLTVRPKGHVLPENVAEDLPKATEAMTAFGLSPRMITTKVVDADDPLDRQVLRTASQLGYDFYRSGWYKYSEDREIRESVRLYKERLKALARLNKTLGIAGSYHNHSGHFLGASLWDLDETLEGLSPEQMGCQYDIMHATVEGGKNWQIGFRLIKDHINTLVIKDFKWARVGGMWKPVYSPLGEGMIDFVRFFKLLKQYHINVPVSVHCEYDLGGAEHGGTSSIDSKSVFEKLKQDLQFLRAAWEKAG